MAHIPTICDCGSLMEVCRFCRFVFCPDCEHMHEDECANKEYEYEREQALRDVDDKWGVR